MAYNTRFQAKKIQEEQRQAEDVLALDQAAAYPLSLMDKLDAASTFPDRLELTIVLYRHFAAEPLLLTKWESFRSVISKQMDKMKTTLLTKMQKLPPTSERTKEFWRERGLVIQLWDQIELVRQLYW